MTHSGGDHPKSPLALLLVVNPMEVPQRCAVFAASPTGPEALREEGHVADEWKEVYNKPSWIM